jgi:hypothetical protein
VQIKLVNAWSAEVHLAMNFDQILAYVDQAGAFYICLNKCA